MEKEATVYLVDNDFSGHHNIYLNTLANNIKFAKNISKEVKFADSRKNIRFHYDRYKFIRNIIKETNINKSNNSDIIHILTLDTLYRSQKFIKYLLKKCKVIATLHHIPNKKKLITNLIKISKVIDVIIVHSDYLRDELLKYGIKNVSVINYPSFYSYSDKNKNYIKSEMNINNEKIIISALGGTRFDKGLDILLESLGGLTEEWKKNIIVNIAGKEEYFKRDFIVSKLNNIGIEYKLNLNFMSDSEFCENVIISDIIVLPYRNSFTGNSGPMTEAIINNIPIITPMNTNIGFITNNNNLGVTFINEDSNSLAQSIEYILNKNFSYNSKSHKYRDKLTKERFIKEYKKIYIEMNKNLI